MTVDNPLSIEQLNEQLQQLSEKLTMMETRLSSLEKPQLMYRPPKSDTHESIVDTLNYLHNSVDELLTCTSSQDQNL